MFRNFIFLIFAMAGADLAFADPAVNHTCLTENALSPDNIVESAKEKPHGDDIPHTCIKASVHDFVDENLEIKFLDIESGYNKRLICEVVEKWGPHASPLPDTGGIKSINLREIHMDFPRFDEDEGGVKTPRCRIYRPK